VRLQIHKNFPKNIAQKLHKNFVQFAQCSNTPIYVGFKHKNFFKFFFIKVLTNFFKCDKVLSVKGKTPKNRKGGHVIMTNIKIFINGAYIGNEIASVDRILELTNSGFTVVRG
jgi:hypothetical protein